MVQKFLKVNGTTVPFHNAYYYLYRSGDLEDVCMYKHCMTTTIMSKRKAERNDIESFSFLDGHPFLKKIVSVQTDNERIPVFPWTWLGSTRTFNTPMDRPVSKNDPDYDRKEEYALKFMILFLPFRSVEDLKVDGSYQKRFQLAKEKSEFGDDMLEIAQNIQDLHNSMEATLPVNSLSAETVLVDPEDFIEDEEAENLTDNRDILRYISETLAMGDGEDRLKEETKILNPKHWKKQHTQECAFEDSASLMEPIIEYVEQKSTSTATDKTDPSEKRTSKTVKELNTLSMETLLVAEGKKGKKKKKTQVRANGTWESIVLWGVAAGLDENQQTAFEVLCATFVLTFYDKAERNTVTANEMQHFERNKERLEMLARRLNLDKVITRDAPLRLFVTGPAGAGKCKNLRSVLIALLLLLIFFFYHSKDYG